VTSTGALRIWWQLHLGRVLARAVRRAAVVYNRAAEHDRDSGPDLNRSGSPSTPRLRRLRLTRCTGALRTIVVSRNAPPRRSARHWIRQTAPTTRTFAVPGPVRTTRRSDVLLRPDLRVRRHSRRPALIYGHAVHGHRCTAEPRRTRPRDRAGNALASDVHVDLHYGRAAAASRSCVLGTRRTPSRSSTLELTPRRTKARIEFSTLDISAGLTPRSFGLLSRPSRSWATCSSPRAGDARSRTGWQARGKLIPSDPVRSSSPAFLGSPPAPGTLSKRLPPG
jgi:hypothetical protein